MIDKKEKLKEALLSIDRIEVKNILMQTTQDVPVIKAVESLIVPVLEEIGNEWENGGNSLSQVYMSGRICEEIVDFLLPPKSEIRTSQPKMAIAVLEDHHLLGKRIVYSGLRASGFELIDFGQMDTDTLVKKVVEEKIEILLISVLMLPSALKVLKLREMFDETNNQVKIIVGGAPFRLDENLWREVKADASGNNASEAVNILYKIFEEIS